jgi:glycerol uptake facilitator protein
MKVPCVFRILIGMTPFTGELVGTAILVLLGNAVMANRNLAQAPGGGMGWLGVAIGWSAALFTGMVCVAWASGAHLNPAVTLGFWVAGIFPADQVGHYMLAQVLGAAMGATLVWLAFLPHWGRTQDASATLRCFCAVPAVPAPLGNLLVEIVATAVLVFGILQIKVMQINLDSIAVTPLELGALGAVPIALLTLAIAVGLGGLVTTATNPARDLGPRLMHAVLPIAGKGDGGWGNAWVPLLGPLAGGWLGAWLFMRLGGAA